MLVVWDEELFDLSIPLVQCILKSHHLLLHAHDSCGQGLEEGEEGVVIVGLWGGLGCRRNSWERWGWRRCLEVRARRVRRGSGIRLQSVRRGVDCRS
jgi:hypothetical protein